MKWLSDYVKADMPIKDYCHALTMSGSKVEAFEIEGSNISKVVVGKILSKVQHENADALFVCKVDIGVDTFEKYREHGYGKVVASAMLRETLNQKKTPVWACIEENEASQSLACSIGFDIFELHPYYKIQK